MLETVSGRGISWAICKSAPHSRQTTMPAAASSPPLSFYRPDAFPAAQPTVPKHWRQELRINPILLNQWMYFCRWKSSCALFFVCSCSAHRWNSRARVQHVGQYYVLSRGTSDTKSHVDSHIEQHAGIQGWIVWRRRGGVEKSRDWRSRVDVHGDEWRRICCCKRHLLRYIVRFVGLNFFCERVISVWNYMPADAVDLYDTIRYEMLF